MDVRGGWYGRLSLIVWMAVGDRLYGCWRSFIWRRSLIVCMALGDRLYGRWRSFVWPLGFDRLDGRWRSFVWLLEIVYMAVGV